jgi:hypothetical protein
MPKVNFANVPDPEEFSLVPEGKYLVKIAAIKVEETREHGNEMWRMSQEIMEGEHKGRVIFDRITFSNPKALSRVKLVCSRFGLNTSREVDLQPDMLIGCVAYANVTIREHDGKKYNEIKFAAYERATPEQEATDGVVDEQLANGEEAPPF